MQLGELFCGIRWKVMCRRQVSSEIWRWARLCSVGWRGKCWASCSQSTCSQREWPPGTGRQPSSCCSQWELRLVNSQTGRELSRLKPRGKTSRQPQETTNNAENMKCWNPGENIKVTVNLSDHEVLVIYSTVQMYTMGLSLIQFTSSKSFN